MRHPLREPDWEYVSLGPWTVTHEWDDGRSTTSHHRSLLEAVKKMQATDADRRVVIDARGETVYGTNDDRWPITAVGTREACDAWLAHFGDDPEGAVCTLRVFEMIRESLGQPSQPDRLRDRGAPTGDEFESGWRGLLDTQKQSIGELPATPRVEERHEFDVILTDVGSRKIEVIKVVRQLTRLGLSQAKALVDRAPTAVLREATKGEAEVAVAKLVEAGAHVQLK